jgi:hypothetical protein
MVGATLVGASMAGAVAAVTLAGPLCRCPCSESAAAGGVLASRIKQGHSNRRKSSKHVQLYSTMTQAWQDSRLSARVLAHMVPCSASGHHAPMVVDDLGGQYEDTFDDVEKVCTSPLYEYWVHVSGGARNSVLNNSSPCHGLPRFVGGLGSEY